MPVRSLGSSVLRWPDEAEVSTALERWAAHQAAVRPELRRLGFFGSRARGESGVGSDLDLVAIVARSDRPFLERARAWPSEKLPVPTELLVYTTQEWEELQRGGGKFARTLASEVVWLIDLPDAQRGL